MLLSEEDATSAVEHLARAVRMVIPAAVGVGVSLLDEQGKRLTRAATDEVVGTADDLQYDLGEGPCLTAWSTQTVQRLDDTRGDPRWPDWAWAAAELGVRSAVSVPLAYHGSSLGAMKVYATVPAAFTDQDADVLGLMAEAAATLLGAVSRRISRAGSASRSDRRWRAAR
ncbi:GAF domain-containing protein [Tersicoccus phoenicis]|uniref:GAF domain-containing protein n=1 Tax=Tersicoccus phoenicis TaxID=554083 RepID=UPI0013565E11|nr:GAF domain-containing protein [Tersicoccus phoenicis]